jgi:hypothetical protein
MSLKLIVSSIQSVPTHLPFANEVLSIMPESEAIPRTSFAWPKTDLPRTTIPVSDIGCGKLYTAETIAEILAKHPELIPPAIHHVQSIIEIGHRAIHKALTRQWTLLIHCHGGSSRSVAAAYIILALEDGLNRESETYERLRQVCGRYYAPDPNHNMVRIADQLLKRDGQLIEAHILGLSGTHASQTTDND